MSHSGEAVGSGLPAGPAKLVAAMAAAGIRFRVSYEQPDGVTPIYVGAPVSAIRRFVPEGAEINGDVVRFWDDWICFFCNTTAEL